MSAKIVFCLRSLRSVAAMVAVTVGLSSALAQEKQTPPAPPVPFGKNSVPLKYTSMSGDLNKKGVKQGEVAWTEWWYAKKETDFVHLHAVGMITVVMENPGYITGANLQYLYPRLRHGNKNCRYEGSSPDENGKGLKLKGALSSDLKLSGSVGTTIMADDLDIYEVNADGQAVLWKLSPSGAAKGRLDKIIFTAEWKCPKDLNLDSPRLDSDVYLHVDDWFWNTGYQVEPDMGRIYSKPDGKTDEIGEDSFERCVKRYSPKRKRWCGGVFPPVPDTSDEPPQIIDPDAISTIRSGLQKPASTAGLLGNTERRNGGDRVLNRQLREMVTYRSGNRVPNGSPAIQASRDVPIMGSGSTTPAWREVEQPVSRGAVVLGRGPSRAVVDRIAIPGRGDSKPVSGAVIASNPVLVPGPTRAPSVGAVDTGPVSLPSPGGNATQAIPNRRPVARPDVPNIGTLQVNRGAYRNNFRLAVPGKNKKPDQNSSGQPSDILTDPSFDQ